MTLADNRRAIHCIDGGQGFGYPEPNVKASIKELKMLFDDGLEEQLFEGSYILELIDKIFGKELIE